MNGGTKSRDDMARKTNDDVYLGQQAATDGKISALWLARVRGMRLSHDTNGRTKRSCMTGFLFGWQLFFPPFFRREQLGWGPLDILNRFVNWVVWVALGLWGRVMMDGLWRVRLDTHMGRPTSSSTSTLFFRCLILFFIL